MCEMCLHGQVFTSKKKVQRTRNVAGRDSWSLECGRKEQFLDSMWQAAKVVAVFGVHVAEGNSCWSPCGRQQNLLDPMWQEGTVAGLYVTGRNSC